MSDDTVIGSTNPPIYIADRQWPWDGQTPIGNGLAAELGSSNAPGETPATPGDILDHRNPLGTSPDAVAATEGLPDA